LNLPKVGLVIEPTRLARRLPSLLGGGMAAVVCRPGEIGPLLCATIRPRRAASTSSPVEALTARRFGLKIFAPNLQPALGAVITVSLHENQIENAWEYEEQKQNDSNKYGTAGYFSWRSFIAAVWIRANNVPRSVNARRCRRSCVKGIPPVEELTTVFAFLGVCQDLLGAKWASDGRVGSERRTPMCAAECRISSDWQGTSTATAEIRHLLPPECESGHRLNQHDEAVKVKYQGVVTLQAVVTADGRATNIRAVKGLGVGLDEKAIEAVHSWRFTPARGPDGKPASVLTMIEVTFRPL
jgi:TonB family protein